MSTSLKRGKCSPDFIMLNSLGVLSGVIYISSSPLYPLERIIPHVEVVQKWAEVRLKLKYANVYSQSLSELLKSGAEAP